MFVQPSRLKAQGAALSTVFALGALGACEDPTATTDLRPEGGPEILTVTVMNDPGLFLETATFCKVGDNKRPGFVGVPVAQICDDDLTVGAGFRDPDTGEFTAAKVEDAVPTGWYVRIMFDELLDPDVEDLVEITEDADNDPNTPETGTGKFVGTLVNTQPVNLSCTPMGGTATDIAYDGYYSPSGNRVTWPLGPSLFVQPADLSTVATSSTCVVSAKDTLVDKDNVKVPDAANPDYSWSIAPLSFDASDPEAAAPGEEAEITADTPVALIFNAFIDPASLAAGEVTILEHATADCADATTVAKAAVIDGDPASGVITLNIAATDPTLAWNPDKAYTITFSDDNAVADLAGGPGALPGAADFELCFTTVAP